MIRLALFLAALAAAVPAASAESFRLAPWKDELFAWRVIATDFGGDYVTVAFDQQRDVIDRDVRPDDQVRPEYVSLDVKSVEKDLVLKASGTTVRYVGVGRTDGGARIIVVFIHGWQATRHDGVHDGRSGGNLNRIKNLMARNGGLYLSPDFSAFPSRAKAQVRALIEAEREKSPGAPVFMACASLGARLCHAFAADPATAKLVDGMLFIAGVGSDAFAASAAVKLRTPLYFGHGTKDASVPYAPQERLFRRIKAADPAYPAMFARFETGAHRAPLRMTDWRRVLNWMLAERGG